MIKDDIASVELLKFLDKLDIKISLAVMVRMIMRIRSREIQEAIANTMIYGENNDETEFKGLRQQIEEA